VHTFRLVNAEGRSVFVKFHWNPLAGTHSLVWDEAVKLSGADPDFHRRDLWESIEAGSYPSWELALQVFDEEQADNFSFDVLDPTKLVPEELVPLRTVGRMVLNRNPDNFFAETEQVPLPPTTSSRASTSATTRCCRGATFSYLDTQLSRLGGPNFHELPINSAVAPVHNNQRDSMHRQAIPRGRVAYEPNSLGGGCPFQVGARGYASFPARLQPEADKLRVKPEKFADHYTQATLFWRSQTAVEQNHIVGAFRFELTKVQTPAVRERIVAMLAQRRRNAGAARGRRAGHRTAAADAARARQRRGARGRHLAGTVAAGTARPHRRARAQGGSAGGRGLPGGGAAQRARGLEPRRRSAEVRRRPSRRGGVRRRPDRGRRQLRSCTFGGLGCRRAPGRCRGAGGAGAPGRRGDLRSRAVPALQDAAGAGRCDGLLDVAVPAISLPDGSADPGIVVVSGSAAQGAGTVKRFVAALTRHRHYERETELPLR